MKAIASLILTVAWVCGLVLAKGFWSTLFAIFIPLWAWYLVAERLVEKFL
jgi:hypothetical protein